MDKQKTYNDARLLQALADGDQDAFVAIYNRFFPVLYKTFRKLLKSEELSGKVVQKVFEALWDSRLECAAVKDLEEFIYDFARDQSRIVIKEHINKKDDGNTFR